jgi:hypothetical protein
MPPYFLSADIERNGKTSGGSHMRNLTLATLGLGAMLALGATAANAAPEPSQTTCVEAQHKVFDALQSDTSANHEQATKESRYGREFCGSGLYAKGMQHYAQAMKLLGIS